MPGEFDRERAIRFMRLPADADDAQIAREIRALARTFRRMGRPLVLPRDLDLAGCVAAIDQRVEDEVTLAMKINREINERQDRLRTIDRRLLCLEVVRHAYYAPKPPGSRE